MGGTKGEKKPSIWKPSIWIIYGQHGTGKSASGSGQEQVLCYNKELINKHEGPAILNFRINLIRTNKGCVFKEEDLGQSAQLS